MLKYVWQYYMYIKNSEEEPLQMCQLYYIFLTVFLNDNSKSVQASALTLTFLCVALIYISFREHLHFHLLP